MTKIGNAELPEKNNDPRAAHRVYVFPTATHVRFEYDGYIISLAADGQETYVFDANGEQVAEFPSTSAKSVYSAVSFIKDMKHD